MAAIAVGAGGTLQSATVEGQIGELAQLIANWQKNTTLNPQEFSRITTSGGSNFESIGISYNFPLTAVPAAGGGYVYQATEFLISPPFTPGSGGTINDPGPLGYFFRLIQHAQELESPLQAGVGSIDRIGGSLNINNKTFAGTTTLFCTPSISASGAVVLTPVEYL